ncbi:MAG: hypothetical protein MUO67_12350, partial [Anaerolineales bacterium]|nr:hypothetical protein [Anaerolineales bacterium]
MKKNLGIIIAVALGLSSLLLTIAFNVGWVKARSPVREVDMPVPSFISYQGTISDGGVPYNGTGYFKFAIVDAAGTDTSWSNDGTSFYGAEPVTSVSLNVSNGGFSVNLGETSLPNMPSPIDALVFDDPETFLRVWFSPDNSTWTQLTPDQAIASVPYALNSHFAIYADAAYSATIADVASSSSFALNANKLDDHFAEDFQMRVMGTCPPGQAIGAVLTDGTVICNFPPSHTLSSLGAGHDLVDAMVDIAIGSDGLGVIAYLNATSGNLNVFHCDDPNCRSGTNQVVDSADDVGYYPSIAIGTDDFPLISYFDNTNDDLKVVHCSNVDCSSRTISIPDPTGSVGYDTSITIGGDGLGLISYYNLTNGNLKVAHCSNTACTSFTISALDTVGDVGQGSSITTNTNGLGLISYYDLTNDNVKLAYCANATCSSTSNMGTLTGPGGYGGTSLAIGSDGFPLVIYIDSVNYDLWIVHCADALCIAKLKYQLDTINY